MRKMCLLSYWKAAIDLNNERQLVFNFYDAPSPCYNLQKVISFKETLVSPSPYTARQSWTCVPQMLSRHAPARLFQMVSRTALSCTFQQQKFASFSAMSRLCVLRRQIAFALGMRRRENVHVCPALYSLNS